MNTNQSYQVAIAKMVEALRAGTITETQFNMVARALEGMKAGEATK